jgi:hypothetical protein
MYSTGSPPHEPLRRASSEVEAAHHQPEGRRVRPGTRPTRPTRRRRSSGRRRKGDSAASTRTALPRLPRVAHSIATDEPNCSARKGSSLRGRRALCRPAQDRAIRTRPRGRARDCRARGTAPPRGRPAGPTSTPGRARRAPRGGPDGAGPTRRRHPGAGPTRQRSRSGSSCARLVRGGFVAARRCSPSIASRPDISSPSRSRW